MKDTKTKTIFACQNCGAQSPKWQGRCPDCNSWNSFVEEVSFSGKSSFLEGIANKESPVLLKNIEIKAEDRIDTGITELNRVLGGGIVVGSVILIGGDPGIGKSTIALQACANLKNDITILYVSAEESPKQTKMRADRLNTAIGDNLFIVNLNNLEAIIEAIKKVKAKVAVIDSIQVIYSDQVPSGPGSVSQVRECANMLTQLAKRMDISMFIIGHVTKDGSIAGPRVLEHIVDTVLYFEGERFSAYRILRAVKNRFGSTNEIGVFEMRDIGLEQVKNPSEYFLSEKREDISGSVICAALEGTRPLLVEIQALVSKAGFGMIRRRAEGVDQNRLTLLVAVLEKRIGMKLEDKDIFVNVVGGIKIDDPASDLATITAIASACYDKPITRDYIVIGEVGLGGEIRSVINIASRLKEAEKLGFKKAIIPRLNKGKQEVLDNLELFPFDNIRESFKFLWKGEIK